MTGPEHYRRAEQVLAQVEDRDVSAAEVAAFTAVAQVHATLAHAAATAVNDLQGWCAVAIKPERPAVTP